VINQQNIPLDAPVILAPNHQNALMDAMSLVINLPFQCVFLARADIFKGKRLIKFLTFLNIMPIYRLRDGIENVKRNDEVFDKTIQVLHNKNNPLGLFPEGNHGDKRRLRPLVKGLFRIALQAQVKYGELPGVKIVPVGLDYGHYQNFRTTLFVNIGKPIEVSEFYSTYMINPIAAINDLKDAFAVALSKQMIDIQSEEYYDMFMHLREIFRDDMKALLHIKESGLEADFSTDKAMIELLNKELETNPGLIDKLNKQVLAYEEGLKKVQLRDWILKKDQPGMLRLIMAASLKVLLLPVFFFGLLNNFLPYWFAASKVRNLKDTQFHSSFKYVIGMIVFPVWYILIAVILALFHAPFWLAALYIAALPFAGLASFSYFIHLKKLIAGIKYKIIRNTPVIIDLRNTRKDITDRLNTLAKKNFNS
jgi:1-acyl-sn-glycerol-3-phosphate acyltransferase